MTVAVDAVQCNDEGNSRKATQLIQGFPTSGGKGKDCENRLGLADHTSGAVSQTVHEVSDCMCAVGQIAVCSGSGAGANYGAADETAGV